MDWLKRFFEICMAWEYISLNFACFISIISTIFCLSFSIKATTFSIVFIFRSLFCNKLFCSLYLFLYSSMSLFRVCIWDDFSSIVLFELSVSLLCCSFCSCMVLLEDSASLVYLFLCSCMSSFRVCIWDDLSYIVLF